MTREPSRIGISKDGGRLDCGCWVNTLIQYRCPLHAAAPELLWALKLCQVRVFMAEGSENEAYQLASAALAKATVRP